MNQKTLLKKSAIAVAFALTAAQASAAGFQLNEYSAAGLGRSFAGEGAIADNASVGSRNPAAMSMFDSTAVSAGVIYVNPEVDIKGEAGVAGIGKPGNADAKNIAPSQFIPNGHVIMPVNDWLTVGGSLTSNFGLATEFKQDYNAGLLGGTTDLKTVNFNTSAAIKLNDHFSIGLGLNAIYAMAEIERPLGNALGSMLEGPMPALVKMMINQKLAALGIKLTDDQFAMLSEASKGVTAKSLKGNEWGFGWNAGVLYQINEDHRYGLSYRSGSKIKFKGDYRGPLESIINKDITGKLDLNLPEVWELSGYDKVSDRWAVHYGVMFTEWSSFKELRAVGSDGKELFQKDEQFSNVWRFALGSTYYMNDQWTFRGGVAYDMSPSKTHQSISIPDQNRWWFSLGTTYAMSKNMSVDLGLSYMLGEKTQFTEKHDLSEILPGANYVGNFEAKGQAWLAGVNFNYKF